MTGDAFNLLAKEDLSLEGSSSFTNSNPQCERRRPSFSGRVKNTIVTRFGMIANSSQNLSHIIS